MASMGATSSPKQYDYSLKFILVGDSDVGKNEILDILVADSIAVVDSPYACSDGVCCRTKTILIDGRKVRLQVWDASGQGRFSTIFNSYSRGAQGILLVYDITNKWSFEDIDRWLKEVDEHAPGVPKILVGNRLHLEYKRQVSIELAEVYASRNDMTFFEVSPLCNFNITESFIELSRVALKRHGMERVWRLSKVHRLEDLCCRTIVSHIEPRAIEQLPLPQNLKTKLRSFCNAHRTNAIILPHRPSKKQSKTCIRPGDSPPMSCRNSCTIS